MSFESDAVPDERSIKKVAVIGQYNKKTDVNQDLEM